MDDIQVQIQVAPPGPRGSIIGEERGKGKGRGGVEGGEVEGGEQPTPKVSKN